MAETGLSKPDLRFRFRIHPATRGEGYEMTGVKKDFAWAENTSAESLQKMLEAKEPPSETDRDKATNYVEEFLKGAAAEQGPFTKPLGFIGKQLLPYLRRLARKANGSSKCNLVFRRVADFRYVRLADNTLRLPPLAYLGKWSHEQKYCNEVNGFVLWALLKWNKSGEIRRDLISWLQGNANCCLLETSPLSSFELSIELSVVHSKGEIYAVTGKVSDVRLPNITWTGRGNSRVVGALPSLLSLWHSPNERNKYAKKALRGELLLASPHLRNAATRGVELWRDSTLRSALLIAPPGSGKEVLSDFLHAGRVLFRPRAQEMRAPYRSLDILKTDFGLPTIQIAQGADWMGTVYGRCDSVTPGRKIRKGQIVGGYDWHGGLLRKARGTTVFFDEIDKADKSELRALLRFLENDDILPEGGETITLGKGDTKKEETGSFKCLRLFAGSKPRNEMFEIEPPDFWTRIQLVIDMIHPLEVQEREERLRCLQEYVLMFLYRTVEKADVVATKGEKDALKQVCKNINAGVASNSKHLAKIASAIDKKEYPFIYLDAEYARLLSKHVAEFLVWIPSARLSVRNLKALIKRLDSRIQDWIMYRFDALDTEAPRSSGTDPISTLADDLESLANGKKNKATVIQKELVNHAKKLRGYVEDRHRDRAWLWAHLHQLALEVCDA